MLNMYNNAARHEIIEASYNLYINGICHYSRVMPFHDMIYIIEGGWEIYQNDEKYETYPDDVIILQAHQHHYGLKPCLPNTKTMFLHISSEHGDGFVSEDSEKEKQKSYVKTLINCRENKKVKELFKEIIAEKWLITPQSGVKMSALFDLLLCELMKSKNEKNQKSTNLLNELLYIFRSNPNIFFTVGELAETLNVSEKTLQNITKKHTGNTVHQYQIEKKLETAIIQLQLQPDMKIRELALNLGFYDEFHLSKLFKTKYNKSIREYRTEIQNMEINNCSI